MKRLFLYPQPWIYVLTGALVIISCLSCKKEIHEEAVSGEAKIRLINASQNTSFIDFYIDNIKMTTLGLAYGENSEYIKVTSGLKQTRVFPTDQSSEEVTSSFNFVPTFSYTLLYIEDKEKKGEVIALEDNLGAVEADKVKIRFINLNAGLSNSLRVILPGGELLVNTLSYKAYTDYYLLPAGVGLAVAVNDSVVIKTLPSTALKGGKNYTIWIGGESNSTMTINKITYN